MSFYYGDGSGSYELPVHLDARASTMIDLMMLIESQQPDANGHTFPRSETAGSAIIRSAAGSKTPVNLVVAGGTFNVQTATCGPVCITCCGYLNLVINPSNFICPVAGGHVFVTFDRGVNWQQRDIRGVANPHFRALIVEPTDDLIAYAVRDRFDGAHAFRTTNGGQSWIDVSGNCPNCLLNLPVNAIVLDPGTTPQKFRQGREKAIADALQRAQQERQALSETRRRLRWYFNPEQNTPH